MFLAAKESGVIPVPSEPYKVTIAGLELIPKVAACVIDGKVSFTNEDRAPVTVLLDDHAATTLAPGQTFVYDCRPGSSALRKLRVKEWPHIRGVLFVGEVGVVGQVNAGGGFALAAPTGKYELQVIGDRGALTTKPVEIKAGDVDVGKLTITPVNERTAEQPSIEPVAPIEPVKKDVPAPVKDKPKDPVPAKAKDPVPAKAKDPIKKDAALVPAKKLILPVLPKPAEKAPVDDAENLEFESE